MFRDIIEYRFPFASAVMEVAWWKYWHFHTVSKNRDSSLLRLSEVGFFLAEWGRQTVYTCCLFKVKKE
jgi:hypothetical protein